MELQIFNNSEFGQIRSLVLDDEVWFIGKDITMALGYSNDRKALQDNVDVEDRRLIQKSLCGTLEIPNRGVTAINESGLYSLVLRSKLPNAKKFKKWVTSEVLPSIRKTGSYQKPLSTQEMMRIQLGMIDDVSDRVTNLENTMNIDYGQQHSLGELISSRVIELVGGKKSNAYKEIGWKVFSEINHDYKDYFNVNARGNTPRLKYEEAVEYVKNWIPSTNTMMLIKDCNAQMPMPEDWR
nr:MAG TPA: repressor domain protein [Caudoviricetes sp.]